MKFVYKSHFKFRAKQRKVRLELAKTIFKQSAEKYFDTLRNHRVAIADVQFEGKIRKLMVAYDRIGDRVEFITTHLIREKEIKNKVESGRWSHEQN